MSKPKKGLDDDRSRLHHIDNVYGLLKQIVDAVKWLGIAYFVYKSLDSLAGKMTHADIKIDAALFQEECTGIPLGVFLFVIFFSLFVAILGIIYGRRESKLRKDTVQRLTLQITTLQQILDSKRSSSMLTSRGDTSEKDRR